MKTMLIVAGLIVSGAGMAAAQSAPAGSVSGGGAHAIIALPDKVEFGPAPASLPAGARAAVLEGDPAQPGLFTLRLWLPDGYAIPPHPADDPRKTK